MKTYLVAALALALAIGTVPAMAKGETGGGGGGSSSHSSSGNSANKGGTPTGEFLAGGINHHGLRDTGTDNTPNAVDGPVVSPMLSSRCTAILDAPRMHTRSQVDYCLGQRG